MYSGKCWQRARSNEESLATTISDPFAWAVQIDGIGGVKRATKRARVMVKFLVTAGAYFLGSRLSELLISQGHSVMALDG